MELKSEYFEKLWLSDNQKKEPTVDFWDFRAEEYNNSQTSMTARVTQEEKVQELLDKAIINNESTVLDIGCGTGQFAVELGKVVKHVVGLDFSENMLLYAKQNAENAGLTNIDFVKSDWDSFVSEQRFDFVLASMSPAIHGPDQLYKMLDFSTGTCYISAFVERHSALKEQLYVLTDQAYVRQFNKLNYIFNLLWTKGLFPVLSYEIGTYERVFSVAKAKGIFPQELSVADDAKLVTSITKYLESAAENGMVTEVLQQRKGELIWKMS
ncbi:MAG: class I SAM-dependent methyltransferase [Acetobacterium sp.]|nr:class I SAM-dependent methyltransferase [Bacillota bacterium]MCG2730047.1 class I SAM-dependent methyltransferase [Acetobacterium sp.]